MSQSGGGGRRAVLGMGTLRESQARRGRPQPPTQVPPITSQPRPPPRCPRYCRRHPRRALGSKKLPLLRRPDTTLLPDARARKERESRPASVKEEEQGQRSERSEGWNALLVIKRALLVIEAVHIYPTPRVRSYRTPPHLGCGSPPTLRATGRILAATSHRRQDTTAVELTPAART